MVRLPALVFAIRAGPRLRRSIKVVSKLRQSSIKVSSFAKGNPWTSRLGFVQAR